MSRSVCTCSPLSPCSHRKHHQQSAEVKYRLMSYNHHSFTKPSAYINRSSMHLTTADYFWNVWKKFIWLFLSAVHKGAVITDKKETTRSGQESDSNKYKTSNQLKKKINISAACLNRKVCEHIPLQYPAPPGFCW